MEREKDRNNRKFWRSMLSVLLLIITSQVWAVEVNTVNNLVSALGNAKSIGNNTVELTGNVELKQTINITGNSLTLDLNGYSIYNGSYKGGILNLTTYYYEIDIFDITGGTLTVQGNGSVYNRKTERNSTIWVNGGTLIVKSKIYSEEKDAIAIDNGSIHIENGAYIESKKDGDPSLLIKGGDVIMNGGTIYRNLGVGLANSGTPAVIVQNGKFRMTGGQISSHKNAWYAYGVRIDSGSFEMEGGEIITTKGGGSLVTAKSLDIKGGNVILKRGKLSSPDNAISSIYNLGQLLVSGYGIYKNEVLQNVSNSVNGTIEIKPIIYHITYENIENATLTGNCPTEYTIETEKFTISASATKNYYDFQGWRLENEVGKTITIPKGSTGDKTLTAVWKGKEYNIHYNLNGGENSTNNKSKYIYSTENPVPLYDPTRSYYTFENWYTDQSLTNLFGKEIPRGQSGELHLYAKWKADSYAVKFYDGDVELTDYEKSRSVEKGIPTSEMPKPSKDGHVFLYWTSNGQKMESVPAGHEPLSLIAQWKEISFIVKYNSNGGTGLEDERYTRATVSDRVWKTEEHIKKEGYVFKGWFLKSDLSGERLTTFPLNIKLGSVSQDGTVVTYTLYAKWELKNYSIVFQNCDGVDNKNYSIIEGVSKENMPKPNERNGYKFIGWYDNNGVLVESIEKGTGDIYLTAKWDPIEYTIKYVTNGGTISGEVTKYTIKESVNVKLETPTKDNYNFAGWYTDSELTNLFNSEYLGETYGDKVFYAKWSPKTYTLTFNPTGGRISQTEQKYIYGEVAEFARKPYKDHYKFDGWYYDEACTKAYGSKVAAGNSGDHTLYAKWKLEDYKIVLDSYNGEFPTGTNIPTTYTYESTIEKLPEPRRQGFTFAGWYADDLLTKPVSSPVIKKGEFGDKKFYATWDRGYQVIFTQPSYGKITVTWNGNAVPAGTMIGKGESLIVTAEATNVNYELKQLLINGKPFTSSPQLVTMPKEDLKITAEFTEASTPAASAPELIITPSGVDKFPKGEDVKVQLKKTDEATTLYYSLDGSAEKKYEREFAIGSAQDTVLLKAIARKPGFRDGVTSRYIIFDNGKITLTFDLPLGVKAVNPSGGEVVTATTTGGSFEFELKVDKEYYTNLDSMVVSANDSIIKPGSAGLYTLANCSSDVTVTVSGLKAKVCTVTLQQTGNGNISFTDGAEETTMEVDYGASVSITAKADEDFKFLQWSTGSQNNPLKLTVDKDTTISARFISDYKAYAITLPQLEGVTVKPFSGYSTEVKKDGTFKFYLKLADGYREENLVVRANGEELEKNKGGYAIYYINKNISISVEGIVREPIDLKVPENVQAKVVETMTDPSGERVYGETMILLYAEAPAGKTFSKWTDGKTDNPRLATAQDAAQLHPLFVDKEDENYAKVTLHQSPGAAITTVNANIDAVKKDEMVQLKVVLLPAYSQSDVILTVDDQVVKPEISLRAASETKTHVFFVPVTKDDITVKVSGIKRNSYHVSVAQTNGGTVSATSGGEITHGETVRLKAQPEPGMLFIKWWDGNTLNPYPYVVTSDTEVKAYFVGIASTVDNETIRNDENVRITVGGGTLSILTEEASMVYIWDHKGALFHAQKVSAGRYAFDLPAGIYLIKVGDLGVKKVMVGGPSSI